MHPVVDLFVVLPAVREMGAWRERLRDKGFSSSTWAEKLGMCAVVAMLGWIWGRTSLPQIPVYLTLT